MERVAQVLGTNNMSRPTTTIHGHPLANNRGVLRVSRAVLYAKLSGTAGKCYWCKCALTWGTLCADHVDGDPENNKPANLVGSCRGCNANREDGTGYGRRGPKPCAVCGEPFHAGKHQKTQTHCSLSCARKNRPKRGSSVAHGSRTRYVKGCRCVECRHANTEWARTNRMRKAITNY